MSKPKILVEICVDFADENKKASQGLKVGRKNESNENGSAKSSQEVHSGSEVGKIGQVRWRRFEC